MNNLSHGCKVQGSIVTLYSHAIFKLIAEFFGTELENAIKNAIEYAENSNEKQERHERLTIGAQKELAQLLGLEKISRIEGFDISNISGEYMVAGMCVAKDRSY